MFYIANFLSCHNYPLFIVRRLAAASEWEGLGAFTENLLKGQLKTGLWVLHLLLQLLQLLLRLHCRRSLHPRKISPPNCSSCQLDRRSFMNVSWKLLFGVVFQNHDAFRSLGSSYWTSVSGARGKDKGPISVFVFHVSLIFILCTSHSGSRTGLSICVIRHVL